LCDEQGRLRVSLGVREAGPVLGLYDAAHKPIWSAP